MDFPSFNHHHHRYVPPPPPPHNYPEDRPNFYHHLIPSVNHPPPPPRSYLHLPPPPPVPPPPPPSYKPDFTFLDAPKPSYFNHNRSPPRVSSRFDYRTGSRSDLGWDLHRNPVDLYSRNPQSENYHKPRFVDDHTDGHATRDFNNIVSHEQQIFSARNSENYVEKYEPLYMPLSESERIWDHSREEDPKWVMKGKKNELGHNDGASYGYSREREREQSRDYERDSSKFNRVIREGREDYKQVQKKSVLLRIGKPNNSNRKSYLVESNNSNHRGKDKGKDKDRDRDHTVEGSRENSPVDLDVSFKSNALIAKPVVTPSSPVSDNNSTPTRNRKIKRVAEFDSPLSKFSERSGKSRSSSRGFDSPSSSEKAPKQVVDKESVSKGDNSSLSGPVLDQGDGKAGSKGPLSFRLKKKRKLINPGSSSFDFQLAVKENNVKAESSKNISNARISSVITFPTLEEIVSGEVDKSPKKDVLEVENQNLDCVNGFGDDCTENKNLTAENVTMIDLNQQPCGNEDSVKFENDIRNTSVDINLSPGGTDIFATSADDQIEIQKLSTESVSFEVVNVSNRLCNEPVKVQETSTITDKNSNVFNSLCNESVEVQETGTIADKNSNVSDSLRNESVEIQETSTIADTNFIDSCSDEIVIISPEQSADQGFLDDVKEDESRVIEGTSNEISLNGSSESSKDDSKGSTHTVIIAEDNATHSSPREEHSFDKDTTTEIVNLISSSVFTPSPHHEERSTDSKDDLPPSFANDTSTFVADSNANSGEPMPDILTGICSPENVSIPDSQMLNIESTDKMLSDLGIPGNDDNIFVKSVSEDIAQLNAPKTGIKTSHYEVTNTVPSASDGSNVKSLGSNTNLPLKKRGSGPGVFPARSLPVFTNARINKTAKNITKPRTWLRSSSNPASVQVPLPPKQTVTGQNSYVRSGNSLVRKGAPVTAVASRSSVYQLNPSGPIEARNSAGSGNKLNNTYSRLAGSSAPVVRPNTPPLSGSTKLPDCPTDSRDLPSSPLELPPASVEDQIHTSGKSESQKIVDEVVTGMKIQYVKRKSNQLVAAMCSDQPIQDLDKAQPSLSSDSYYKRIKNQLIRTSVGDDSANTSVDKASKISLKRQSGKGISKKYKHLRFPSVWTLNSQSLRPQLLPWKRSRNWGNLINASSNSSSSSISRKLLLSRKRETIYTRSKHGFSLRMSKLLSVGGASLKWSKSIERNSKRTNEEATLAVAAAEKKKREQHGTAEIKSRNNTSRERIFRIGSVRYKMDPSRRTLQRISDEEPSNSVQSKEEVKKTYIPKRLKIGHDEYVRIGNGNQLVRNPKRRTRVFASEKVRWSLHTARTRLAKKKRFCQFFTRFGKCNKDDGKCPYIHDSSKIAVCTKFLNGLCFDPNCKLTHKVIPERMQDCSYFLQGLCSNKHCPYRHVNVNSTASVCEGFLKGYCADGNECQKKHSYACPAFEATGSCSQGTKCKLHHPKNQLKRKHQSSTGQQTKNSRGRYFGSVRGEEVMRVSEKSNLKNDDVDEGMLCQEGKFAEYISLDCGNEEGGDEVIGDTRTRLSGEPLGFGVGEIDELIKPIGIMKRVVSSEL